MQTIKKILCATDLSEFSSHLLSQGVALCLQFDAELCVFHAISPPPGPVSRRVEFERGGEKTERIESAREKIKKFMARFDMEWDLVVTYGDPVLEATKVAREVNADIVMAASHGLSGLQHFFAGSVIGRMAQTVLQPLLVIPPCKTASDARSLEPEFTHVIMACSLLESDAYLREYAWAFVEKFNSRICLVHVMESPLNDEVVDSMSAPYDGVQRLLEEKLWLRLQELMPGEPQILRGVPGEELVLYAKSHETGLIIAGVDDRPGRIIATTTAALLRHLPCPVLTIPLRQGGNVH